MKEKKVSVMIERNEWTVLWMKDSLVQRQRKIEGKKIKMFQWKKGEIVQSEKNGEKRKP